jgi:tetratricopeptide (TPR) repeat protein
LAVQWVNGALCFLSSSVLADSFVFRNRQLLVAAKHYVQFDSLTKMRIIISILILLGFYSCDNKTSDYYYNLACDEEQKGNLPAAINYLDKALEINPKDIGALNNRGYDYLELKKYDLAKSSFQKMVDLDNNCPGAYYGLGYLNYKLQNYENAISYFDTVIKHGLSESGRSVGTSTVCAFN